jgi:hypothetical protein
MAEVIHRTERLSKENIHYLPELYEQINGNKIPTDFFLKKFNASRFEKSYYGYFAFNGSGKVIAFMGCILFAIELNGIKEICAQSCDSITLKEYQGKGIFKVLGKLTENLLKSEGINFFYGFPNEASAKTYVKNDWECHGSVTGFKVPVKTFPREKVFRKIGFGKLYDSFVKSRLTKLLSSERILPNSMQDKIHPAILRDKSFFEYKCFTPNYIIEIGNVKVWMKIQSGMHIGDIDTLEENKLLETITGLKQIAKRLGVTSIILQYQEGSAQEIILKKHFESFLSWKLVFTNFSSKLPLDKFRVNYGDLDSF